jgi:hypothetical protein
LRALVATAEQDHKRFAPADEVDPKPRAMIDAKLADAIAYRLHVSGVPPARRAIRLAIIARATLSFSLVSQISNAAVWRTSTTKNVSYGRQMSSADEAASPMFRHYTKWNKKRT